MTKHVIARRLPTPGTPAGGPSSVRLPDDVVADQVARLKLFALISGGMWLLGLLMDGFAFPAAMPYKVTNSTLVIESVAVLFAAAVYLFVSLSARAPRSKADAGLWLMMLNSAAIALLETWSREPTRESFGHLSWIPIVILLSAMIMPGRPRPMLVAALASASMGPLGVWFAHLRGVDVPGVVDTLAMAMPNYSCAIAAVLPSQMFQRMGRRLSEARELGSYELIEQLGEGGMGAVWRARHRLLARDAAVKLVRPEAMGDTALAAQAQLRRFEREAQATAALSSEHSVRLFDFGATDDGSFYYVMELLLGLDLESLVREFGPLPPERAMFLLQQVCHSLAEAHDRGLVHRDVKPANIFVCRMGRDFDYVKVLDFGLVQTRKTDPATAVTETLVTAHTLIGTPAYMAPEVILGHDNVDRRADVYAIGCVAFYLLTGTRVFQDGTQMQALVDHVHAAPVAPSQRVTGGLPREIDELVLWCLRKEPADRPQDAGELLAAINGIHFARKWSNDQARAWWQARLPELSGPLAPGA
ncbi:MAG: serine/threonine-protein kinase [Vicinamibacterales bacterium]